MDLYQKKNNVPSARTQRSRDNYDETNNNQPSRYRYSQTRDNNAISQDNYRNNLRESEDNQGNDSQRKNMRYVINLGKTKENDNPRPSLRDNQQNKSTSFDQSGKDRINKPYVKKERFKDLPNLQYSKRPKEPQYSANNTRYNTINDISNITPKENNDYRKVIILNLKFLLYMTMIKIQEVPNQEYHLK